MVSTRGVRYKFSEGERVLCYEPDPTKAKVLYDSKVLEVIDSKDKRGRRAVEYLIHFQGWNSSWDRCVSEDFVLKDTEENRRLQIDLAEKAQLQLGAYLYRRERKRGSSMSAGSGAAKRSRLGFSDDGSYGSPPLNTDVVPGLAPPDSDGDSSEEIVVDDGCVLSPPVAPSSRSTITIPPSLRDRLTLDFHLVMKRGKRACLPASPSAATILESFVKWFARAGAWHPPRQRNDPPHKPNLRDVSCTLNLVREVADGLRTYFDFVLRGQLLYRNEATQYQLHCGDYLYKPPCTIKRENSTDKSAMDSLKSPTPEYSHLPPDPALALADDKIKFPGIQINAGAGNHAGNHHAAGANVLPFAASEGEAVKAEPVEEAATKRPTTRPPMARRLRSHKSALSHSENELEPTPSTSTYDPPSSSVCSSGSSRGESVSRAPPAAAVSRTPLSLLLDKVAKWQIIPTEGTEHLPCRVYGAIHLARLFVRLPEFLHATGMPDHKLKVVLKYSEMFVQYLDEHAEWFGESQYESAPVVPVPVVPAPVVPAPVVPAAVIPAAEVSAAVVLEVENPAPVVPAAEPEADSPEAPGQSQ